MKETSPIESTKNPEKMSHTDIPSNHWIDRRLPASLRPYARLMRLDRPIGVWLLLWPCWWGAALALTAEGFSSRIPLLPFLWTLLVFALGAIVMRGAGCVINDMWDRDLDRQVSRTRTRPLAAKDLNMLQASIFLLFLLLIGLSLLLMFNGVTVFLGIASLGLVIAYPLAKRVFWAPQLILGLAFNWGALLGWTSLNPSLNLAPLSLYLGGVFWTLAYDTIYAHQDSRDDEAVGIKSLALYLGDASRPWIASFYAASLFFFALAGGLAGLSKYFFFGLFLSGLFAGWVMKNWDPEDPQKCLTAFRRNRDFGALIFLSIFAGLF